MGMQGQSHGHRVRRPYKRKNGKRSIMMDAILSNAKNNPRLTVPEERVPSEWAYLPGANR